MEIIKLSSKGQIVIPGKIRQKLGMQEGTILWIEKMNDLVIIKKVDTDFVKKIERSLKDIVHGRIKEWKG